jgi:hypothetical protein
MNKLENKELVKFCALYHKGVTAKEINSAYSVKLNEAFLHRETKKIYGSAKDEQKDANTGRQNLYNDLKENELEAFHDFCYSNIKGIEVSSEHKLYFLGIFKLLLDQYKATKSDFTTIL